MVPLTRRRFLHATTVVAGGLAGCSGLTGDAARSSRSASETMGSNVPTSNTETDPPTIVRRADSEVPPIRLADPEREDADSPEPDGHSSRITNDLIDSRSRSQQLTVADDGDDDTVSSFVSATDFDTETLYVESARLEECFRLHLCRISWQPSSVQTDYVRRLRPYDERCTVDEQIVESRLIRLPVALDEESVNSFGSTISGSGRCDAPSGPRSEGSSGSSRSAGASRRATDGGEH